jgi:hypothetical protein
VSTVLLLLVFWSGKLEIVSQHFNTPGACEEARAWVARQHEGAAAVIRSTCLPDRVEHQR